MHSNSKGTDLESCLEVLSINLCQKSNNVRTHNAQQSREEMLLKLLSIISPDYFKTVSGLDYDGLLRILESYYSDRMK